LNGIGNLWEVNDPTLPVFIHIVPGGAFKGGVKELCNPYTSVPFYVLFLARPPYFWRDRGI